MSACVFALMNVKGGAGKSVAGLVIAQCAAASGLKTLIVDADPQQSQMTWAANAERRGIAIVGLDVMSASDAQLAADAIDGASEDYDVVLGDLPGSQTNTAAVMIQKSNVVVLPGRPSYLDVKGVIEASHYIQGLAADFGFEKPDCRWLLNFMTATQARNALLQGREEIAVSEGFGIIKQIMWQRQSYAELHMGETLWSLSRTPGGRKMADEAREIGKEVLEIVFSEIRPPSALSAPEEEDVVNDG